MKTLDTIQKLSKLGRILSKIVYILCLVGGICSVVGLVGTLLLADGIKLGGVTIHGLIEKNAETSMGTIYASLAAGILLCAGEAVLAKLAETYFRKELEAGTPFTLEGAKELIRLGICAICIPLGAQLLAETVYQIMANVLKGVSELKVESSVSLGLGIMMIIAGLLCRYGAELTQDPSSQGGE